MRRAAMHRQSELSLKTKELVSMNSRKSRIKISVEIKRQYQLSEITLRLFYRVRQGKTL